MGQMKLPARLLALLAFALTPLSASAQTELSPRFQAEMERAVAASRSEHPQTGLASDWLDCLQHELPNAPEDAERIECETWSAQGVTSTIIALKLGNDYVPVVESRLARARVDNGPIVHIAGGPGNAPFHVDASMDIARLERLQGGDTTFLSREDMKASPYRELLGRGYTIASIGYLGTSTRSLEVPDEIQLAIDEVRQVVDYYRDRIGEEPPLVTFSLGNHLLLGAMGQERLEQLDVLALVPVMDGLQHHISRLQREVARAQSLRLFGGEWTEFNLYRREEDALAFDHSRLVALHDLVPSFIGEADLAWSEVTLRTPCSQLVLGSEDPRTLEYLAENENLPPFITVLSAGHDLAYDAPEDTRDIFRTYAQCIRGDGGSEG